MTNYLIGEVSEYIDNIHEVAKDNPMMNEVQYESLRNSIDSIGQQEPIKTWRNKVIDGRNRLKALNDLGIKEVKYIKLPHKASKDELQAIADGSEARRHQTSTQLAIKAFRVYQRTGITLVQAAKNGGISESSIKLVSRINKIRPDILDKLLKGELFKQSNGYATDSLQSIAKDITAVAKNSTMSKDTIKEMITNADKKSDEDKKVDELENKLNSFIALAGITEDDYPQLIEAFDRITQYYRLDTMHFEVESIM